MHAGRLGGNNACTRLYDYLAKCRGQWQDSWALTLATKTTAIGTRKSEVNHELERLGRPEVVEHDQIGDRHYYRLVTLESPCPRLDEVIP